MLLPVGALNVTLATRCSDTPARRLLRGQAARSQVDAADGAADPPRATPLGALIVLARRHCQVSPAAVRPEVAGEHVEVGEEQVAPDRGEHEAGVADGIAAGADRQHAAGDLFDSAAGRRVEGHVRDGHAAPAVLPWIVLLAKPVMIVLATAPPLMTTAAALDTMFVLPLNAEVQRAGRATDVHGRCRRACPRIPGVAGDGERERPRRAGVEIDVDALGAGAVDHVVRNRQCRRAGQRRVAVVTSMAFGACRAASARVISRRDGLGDRDGIAGAAVDDRPRARRCAPGWSATPLPLRLRGIDRPTRFRRSGAGRPRARCRWLIAAVAPWTKM